MSNVKIVRGESPNTFDIRGIEFNTNMLQAGRTDKTLVFTPKINVEDCEMTFIDAAGKSYPLAIADAASLRIPFLSPEALAAQMIADEVIERKNTDRVSKGKSELLTGSQKARNRRKAAAKKWKEAHASKPATLNVIFSDVLADARAQYIEENSEARMSRRLSALNKQAEAGLSLAAVEAAIVQLQFLLGRFDEGTAAYIEVEAEVKRLTNALNEAQAKKQDRIGADLLASGSTEEHLAQQATA